MRTFVTIFLFALFFTQVFSSFVMNEAYLMNRDYVAQNLCVNKDKPMLHCDGKCYLSKQIKKDAATDAATSGARKEKGESLVFLPSYCAAITLYAAAETPAHNGFAAFLLPEHTTLPLRPPCLFTA